MNMNEHARIIRSHRWDVTDDNDDCCWCGGRGEGGTPPGTGAIARAALLYAGKVAPAPHAGNA
jgi:hypothetical protein